MTDPIVAPVAHRVRARRSRHRSVDAGARVGGRPFVPVSYPDGHHDQLVIVKAITEEPLADVRGAQIGNPSWVLNGVGALDFGLMASDDAMDYLIDPATVRDGAGVMKLIGREIQFWRDGVLRWQGPPVRARVNLDGTVAVSCFDNGYYPTRRFFGAAERKDLLNDIGQMDRPGLPGWVDVGGAVRHQDTAIKARRVGSMAIVGTGAVQTTFVHDKTTVSVPLNVRLTGVVRIPSGTPDGTALMTLDIRETAGGPILSTGTAYVTEDLPRGGWPRVTVTAQLQPGFPNHVTATLWSEGTHGTIRFDDVRSLKNDTTGIPIPGADLAVHGLAAVDHWQSRSRGKGSWGMNRKVLIPTGTVEPMGVRHLEHTQATDWLQSMVDRSDGFDWWIGPRLAGEAFQRTIWFSKRRGVDHTQLILHDRNVAAGGWDHDEIELSSDIVVPGEGDGVDRPEGGYSNRSRTAEIALDWFHQPTNGASLASLDPTARQVWEQKSQPQSTPGPLTISADLIDDVVPGDRFPTHLRVGKVRLPGDAGIRVGTITLNRETDQLELV